MSYKLTTVDSVQREMLSIKCGVLDATSLATTSGVSFFSRFLDLCPLASDESVSIQLCFHVKQNKKWKIDN
jgi:hypothetical protein